MPSLLRFLSLCLPALAAFAVALLAPPAHADTYSIQSLTADNKSFYGMDDSGHVVFDSGGTYYIFLDGSPDGTTFTAPAFTWDFSAVPCNTPPCSASDNGRTVTASHVSGPLDDLYVSANGNPPQLIGQTSGIAGDLAINGLGDIVFDSGTLDEWYEAFDVPTAPAPEPRSLLLLATGTLGLAAFALRRRNLAPSA
jgi:hypothetical protein